MTVRRGVAAPTDTEASFIKGLVDRIETMERIAHVHNGGGGNPAGTIIAGVWSSAPAGYALLDGSTIVGAQTAHPELWAAAPVAWRSGSDLVLPSMIDVGRVLMSGGSLGAVDGANTQAIAEANLPSHAHTIDHTHPIDHTHTMAHTHTIDHDHAAFNTASSGAHTHTGRYLTTATGSGSNADLLRPGTSSFSFTGVINAGGTADGAHDHSIDVPAFSGSSGGSSAASTGASSAASSGASSAASTGPVGSDTALNIASARLRVNFAIKL